MAPTSKKASVMARMGASSILLFGRLKASPSLCISLGCNLLFNAIFWAKCPNFSNTAGFGLG